MKHEYKIEKGIKVPKWRRRGTWKDLLADLRAGDSVVVESVSRASGLCGAGKREGFAMCYRKLDDLKCRVWRIE